jgi:DNA-binding NtrC family response regulator
MEQKKFTPQAQEKLMKYAYPGNVRELRSVVELAVVMSDQNQIDSEHIKFNSTHMVTDFLGQENTLAEFNRKIIFYYLDKYDGNVVEAAKKLGVGKSTIYRMLKSEKYS